MTKIENKLERINKRIEEVKENAFYCDNQYKINKAHKNIKDFAKREIEVAYINLRYEELHEELKTLYNLQEQYEKLVQRIIDLENQELDNYTNWLE